MTQPRVIAESKSVSAIAHDFDGDGVVISFNSFGTGRRGLNYWGSGFLAREQISSIGIVTSGPNWYPYREFEEIADAIRNQVGRRRVVTYGFSHGAYGALKFSHMLNACVALAFSPQWSIDPRDVMPFDRGYVEYFDDALMNGTRIVAEDIGELALCVYDPNERVDLIHAKRLSRLARVKEVAFPFTWHGSIVPVIEAHVGGELLRYCLYDTRPDECGVRQILRNCRRESQSYLRTARSRLFERLDKSTLHRSTTFLSRINGKCDTHRDVLSALCRAAHSTTPTGRADLVSSVKHENLRSLVDTDLLAILSICRRHAYAEGELAVALRILNNWPNFTRGCLAAIATLVRAKLDVLARYHLMRIVLENRDAMRHVQKILAISISLKHFDPLEYASKNAFTQGDREIALSNFRLLIKRLEEIPPSR